MHGDNRLEMEGFSVATVDTTGAGDGFVAGLLSSLLYVLGRFEGEKNSESAIAHAARRANAVGALTTTKREQFPLYLPVRRWKSS